ncbi:MAG: NAD(P)(+) transhydrogenase (Re/Si-specific) subunit beta [Fimbriimonadaceae bacterium]|nr:NAD(P)(+) transhydrogenase (Re/Si-specific) subunit beta [Fimbriimonadaceae bacterium]
MNAEQLKQTIDLAYLFGAVCFILAMKLMNSPVTARRGNRLSMLGMAVAIGATFFNPAIRPENLLLIGAAVGVGVVGGLIPAYRVQMTAMPQMVALLNGLGGGAVALVALYEFLDALQKAHVPEPVQRVTTVLSAIIGTISFSGSLIAYGKLQELLPGRAITFKGHGTVNILLGAFTLALAAMILMMGQVTAAAFFALIGLSFVLGISAVLPIGGADMPVVISLLNSFTGCAAGLAGFVLINNSLLIGGALVGASGLILTLLMCRAMNRTLGHVLFSSAGHVLVAGTSTKVAKQPKSYSVEDAAILMSNANRVIVVPGYGMAVAQAQHQVKEMAGKLEAMGVEVIYAVHPVAGRMPGHMNVLLAEADVAYDKLYELEQANPLFPESDVALVIGANDVVNPAARTDPNSPIYGMPILDVDKARTVIVSKRSMNPGFAGIENDLFLNDNTVMVFGNAKTTIGKITAALDNY